MPVLPGALLRIFQQYWHMLFTIIVILLIRLHFSWILIFNCSWYSMIDRKLINKLLQLKEEGNYTLHDLSKKLDIQVTTIERWFKTQRINKVYAQMVREKLNI